MNVDELRNEALHCAYLANRADDPTDADHLRRRGERLARVADFLDRPGPAILGSQPAGPRLSALSLPR